MKTNLVNVTRPLRNKGKNSAICEDLAHVIFNLFLCLYLC